MGCQAYRTRESVCKCRNFQRNFRVQCDAFRRRRRFASTSHARGKRKTLARLAFSRFRSSLPPSPTVLAYRAKQDGGR